MNKPAKKPTNAAKAIAGPAVPPFTPGPIRESAVRKYFARGEMQRITGNRWFLAFMISMGLNAVQGVSNAMLFPLKSVEIIFLHENGGGRLTLEQAGPSASVADHDAIAYYLSEWLDNVYDINASTIQAKLAKAGETAVGNAHDQLQDLIAKENPYGQLHDDPQLRQYFNRLTVNWVNEDTVIVRYTLTKRLAEGAAPQVQTWAMTITYTHIKSTTPDQVKRNPAGIYVTSFNVNQES
ncbi:VirB8/TrbF family protein [Paraburkholderia sp. J8-2]|uniref:VirB8/TrbF family protein n=1 Tax=Paraburkholderia sp. J8-2 TaxID=2805440 RepID=UPI002AB5F409|nr:VirB8/TrbF family protein [Paraburkholderia sp. J8-2]